MQVETMGSIGGRKSMSAAEVIVVIVAIMNIVPMMVADMAMNVGEMSDRARVQARNSPWPCAIFS